MRMPFPRRLIPTESGPKNHYSGSGLKVVSYNILADMYVKTGRDSYHHCPEHCVDWEYRRVKLLKELLGYGADILCLQEVQSDHFFNFFQPALSKCGYAAVYKRRKSQVYNGQGYVADGVAIFFRCNRFNLVRFFPVEYEKLTEERGLMKDNVAVVLILEEKDVYGVPTGTKFCVANTHLSGNKTCSDVRLFQAETLIKGLEKIEAQGFPVLICGDLNSEPKSDTYKFLMNSKKHSMNLESAYSMASDEHKDETLDYILFSTKTMRLDSCLEIPAYQSSGGMRLLPTPELPSDHVALVANVRIREAYLGRNFRDVSCNPWENSKELASKAVNKKPRMTMGPAYSRQPVVAPRAFPFPAPGSYNVPAVRPAFLPFAPQMIC